MIARGFNEFNPYISKITTPNLHLMSGNIKD